MEKQYFDRSMYSSVYSKCMLEFDRCFAEPTKTNYSHLSLPSHLKYPDLDFITVGASKFTKYWVG
jgi:hypothetical protein